MAYYLSLFSNDDGDGRPRECNDGGGADGGGGRNIEDVEVRMDLTDDLLHLVCPSLCLMFNC